MLIAKGSFLLFRPLILWGQAHGGFFCIRGDELVHAVFIKETLQKETHQLVMKAD